MAQEGSGCRGSIVNCWCGFTVSNPNILTRTMVPSAKNKAVENTNKKTNLQNFKSVMWIRIHTFYCGSIFCKPISLHADPDTIADGVKLQNIRIYFKNSLWVFSTCWKVFEGVYLLDPDRRGLPLCGSVLCIRIQIHITALNHLENQSVWYIDKQSPRRFDPFPIN